MADEEKTIQDRIREILQQQVQIQQKQLEQQRETVRLLALLGMPTPKGLAP